MPSGQAEELKLLEDGLAPECPRLPMAEFLEQHPEVCQPCIVAPASQWYHDELNERGQRDLADKVEQLATGGVMEIAKLLDEIKGRVDESTRLRLKEFDCATQTMSLEKTVGGVS